MLPLTWQHLAGAAACQVGGSRSPEGCPALSAFSPPSAGCNEHVWIESLGVRWRATGSRLRGAVLSQTKVAEVKST